MKSGRDLAVIVSFSSDTGIDRCATFKRESGNWRIDQAAWGHPAILARNWLAPPKRARVRTHKHKLVKQASWEDNYFEVLL